MRKILGISIIYLIQQENTLAHFHVWLLPIYPWMIKKFGKEIGMAVRAMEYAQKHFMKQKDIKEINEAVYKLQTYFK